MDRSGGTIGPHTCSHGGSFSPKTSPGCRTGKVLEEVAEAPIINLAPLQAEYDNMLRCIRCAACLTTCPTYVVTHKEEEGPRGRIAIMRAIVEGQLDLTPD